MYVGWVICNDALVVIGEVQAAGSGMSDPRPNYTIYAGNETTHPTLDRKYYWLISENEGFQHGVAIGDTFDPEGYDPSVTVEEYIPS